MGAATIRFDSDKNRIYVTFDGFMTHHEATKLIDKYSVAIEQCRPGFTVLSDLTNFKPSTSEVQTIIARGPKIAGEAGCKRVARVVASSKPLGGMQIDRIAKETSSYPSQHFQTVEEAEIYLDSAREDD